MAQGDDEAEPPSKGKHRSSKHDHAGESSHEKKKHKSAKGDQPGEPPEKKKHKSEKEKHSKKRKAEKALGVCGHIPAIYGSFVDVLFDHAVGNQVLGPTKNPCPAFFRSPDRGDVWSDENWGHYPTLEKDPITRVPAAERLVAVGDLHGDFQKTEEVLKLANVLSDTGNKWCGGKTVLVQVLTVPHHLAPRV